MPDHPPYRLPRTVLPVRYDIKLRPDLKAFSFAGASSVTVEVHEPVREITLNAIELDISTARIEDPDGASQDATISYDEAEQQATFAFGSSLAPGTYTLHTDFTGILNDKLHGFYRSTFTDADGHEQVIATTQFESTDARRAFPCWDEPDIKAAFGITLDVAPGLTALSNGHVVADDPLGDGWRRVRFADTMTMSTYLVAFIVGPLTFTEEVDANGVPLRVACVPGKEHLGEFALEIGEHSLNFFADFFGIPYPSFKLDLVALPDFAFGAMENLGCVTFRETALLVDPASASTQELMRVADVVAHEIAHMWFGDLVTMKWWNGIWLNEAFATFMELMCADAFRPQWKRWGQFATERAASMKVDGLASTRPVEIEVKRPEEADAMFDVLTYQKGSAVVRMLEQYLGPDTFRDGLRLYMRKHAYGNTETTDLWDALEEASGQPARSIMDSWIYQGGYPLVTATTAADGTTLTLSQSRFRYDGQDDDTVWQVPVVVRSADGEQRLVLGKEPQAILVAAEGPVVVNAGGWGFFRVAYDPSLAQRIAAGLASLDEIERYNLASDAWAAALTGRADLDTTLDLLASYTGETDPATWALLAEIAAVLDRVDGSEGLRAYLQDLAGPSTRRLGWDESGGEADTDGMVRGIVLELLGTAGRDAEVIAEARRRVGAAHDGDTTALAGDVRRAALQTVAHGADEADFQTLLDGMRNASTPQEEQQYRFALAAVSHEALARRTCDLCLTEIRSQDVSLVLLYLMQSPQQRVVWEWIEQHWAELQERLPSNLHARSLQGVTTVTDAALAARIRAFLEEDGNMPAVGAATVRQYLELMDTVVRFAGRSRAALTTRFGS
ncbi:MAG TPA: M1 family metallopeptidase [Acidimicrobiales bacterium]|nr:M1 family metallopeptidase [Acidimicrobiales bacterium]